MAMNGKEDLRYLRILSEQFKTIARASTEIINLQSILNLPKGTEHFVSDIHGESEQFLHILKNGSGAIKRKIDEEFGLSLSERDKKEIAFLVYYPNEKLEEIVNKTENLEDWYRITLHRLIKICTRVSSKYTRSKVRKAIPQDFAYIIEELINEKEEILDKEAYYNSIISTVVRIGRAKDFIVVLSNLIQRLVIDHLHIIGDIFDRGSGAHIIMDSLMDYHSVDFQWGNHDVVWMGAASGHLACIANVVRLCARYGNLDTLEEGYGINLIPLVSFAMNTYRNDPCALFQVDKEDKNYLQEEMELEMKMHKAIAIIQFKLEGQLIKRRPDFHMNSRLLLDKIDYEAGTILIDGIRYPLKDRLFQTIHTEDPYELSEEEAFIMEKLRHSFLNCEKLQKHIKFLFTHGSLYLSYNSNLLYHGCVPLNPDGSFRKVNIQGTEYSGKQLYDALEKEIRNGYYIPEDENKKLQGQDRMWYMWSNEDSPLYGKEKMATFERYYIENKEVQEEKKDYYYRLIEKEEVVNRILNDFHLDEQTSHIINGHMPVAIKNGETPVKCGGKVLIIDGGFAKAYFDKTGIAGYTLIYNSYGLRIVSHEPFTSKEEVIAKEMDIHSDMEIIERVARRLVKDTDIGQNIILRIEELEQLLAAYRTGLLTEQIEQ